MNATLTISSQGQVVIPAAIRRILGTKPGDKLNLRLKKQGRSVVAVMEPKTKNWVDRVANIGKGIYGNVDEYITKERNSWK